MLLANGVMMPGCHIILTRNAPGILVSLFPFFPLQNLELNTGQNGKSLFIIDICR